MGYPSRVWVPLQAMANYSELNMENNIGKRDTQFISMFWLKTLENQMHCILPCILLEHTGGINLYFSMKHDSKHRKKRHYVFVRCFGINNRNIMLQNHQIRQFLYSFTGNLQGCFGPKYYIYIVPCYLPQHIAGKNRCYW